MPCKTIPAQTPRTTASTPGKLSGPFAHRVCLTLQSGAIVDRLAIGRRPGGRHTALGLLHRMPGLVGEMAFLPGGHMDIAPLRIGMGLHLSRLRRIAMDAHIAQIHAG